MPPCCAIAKSLNAYIIFPISPKILRPWVHSFSCIIERIAGNLPVCLTWTSSWFFKTLFRKSAQTVINFAFRARKFLRSEKERLEKSCRNASHTTICEMLVVSLDCFQFIILPNFSLLICFTNSQNNNQLRGERIHELCMKHNDESKGKLREGKTFLL